jgi:2-oxoglutarate dehydrogenase E2 component (dihydrolipoamide succinyltransferase)
MPQLGETVTEGTVTKWLKAVGENVARDEPLFEVSTDKVDSEVPSPAEGTLTEIRVQEGETVDVGTVLAVVGAESGAGAPPATPAPAPAAEAPTPPARAPAATQEPPAAPAPSAAATASEPAPAAPPAPETAAPATSPTPAPATPRAPMASTGLTARRDGVTASFRPSSGDCSTTTASTPAK